MVKYNSSGSNGFCYAYCLYAVVDASMYVHTLGQAYTIYNPITLIKSV